MRVDVWLPSSSQWGLLLEASGVTVRILLFAFILGLALSLVFGVARLSEREWMRGVALVFVEFARGISSIILLFIMAIAIPILLGISQEDLIVLASIALGINMGGYGAEIIRGAIQSVPHGQTEASISLNLSPTQRLRYVILPGAMPVILPPLGNLTIEILKGTALVSLVGLTDIMAMTRNIRSQQRNAGDVALENYLMLLLVVLVMYFILAQIINGLFRFWEWRLNKQYRGGPTLTPDELPDHIKSGLPGVSG